MLHCTLTLWSSLLTLGLIFPHCLSTIIFSIIHQEKLPSTLVEPSSKLIPPSSPSISPSTVANHSFLRLPRSVANDMDGKEQLEKFSDLWTNSKVHFWVSLDNRHTEKKSRFSTHTWARVKWRLTQGECRKWDLALASHGDCTPSLVPVLVFCFFFGLPPK